MYPEVWLKGVIEEATGVQTWPLSVAEGPAPPVVIYRRTATDRERTTYAATGSPTATFEVEIHALTYSEAKELAEAVRLGVDNYAGTFKGMAGEVIIQHAYLVDEFDGEPVFFEGRDKPTYMVLHTYHVRFTESPARS
jgi:hypothetical protein